MTIKILLCVPLSPYSGYGNDGLGMARALIARGADVYLKPSVVQAPLPEDVAHLLTKPLDGPFDLTLVHLDPATLEATDALRKGSKMLVGWTMWEYSNLKNSQGRNSHKKRWEKFDALVGYDQVSSEGLRDYFKGPILTQQGGFRPQDWTPVERDWFSEDFYFCQIGVLSERKDPFVSIKAFGELKAEHEDFNKHARLMLKTTTPGLHSKMEDVYPGLRIFYDSWNTETVKEFYAQSHVLLAPSRGEGKNLPALEFLSTGGTVIATNWGGHREWLHPSYAYGIDYTLQPVNADFPNTLNARADVESMKAHMLHVFRNRAEARDKGALGAQIIPQISSWDAVLERLMDKISQVPGGRDTYDKFVNARTEY